MNTAQEYSEEGRPEAGEAPAPKAAVRIVADDREEGGGVPERLRQLPGVEVLVRRLAVGDYEIGGNWVFERKTAVDFAASIIDGRLFKQAWMLARLPRRTALVLEGKAADFAELGMRREAIQGAILTLAFKFELPLLRSFGVEETAQLMVYAAQQQSRESMAELRSYGRKPRSRRRNQMRLLCGLPGVGPDRAKKLLDRFGTVAAVCGCGS